MCFYRVLAYTLHTHLVTYHPCGRCKILLELLVMETTFRCLKRRVINIHIIIEDNIKIG